MKICTIIGARPQFIKAAAVSRAIAAHNRLTSDPLLLTPDGSRLTEILIHTGQHYDEGMSAVFFRELEIPEPKYNLTIGSGSHGAQTGQMLAAIEKVLIEEKPDWVLIYGDTNSTLAGALAAAKLHIPIAHVEAGLRSFNRRMPEEINRIVADQLSTLLLCPSQIAVDNLAAEGIGGKGDRMSTVIDEPPPALRATSASGGQKESSPRMKGAQGLLSPAGGGAGGGHFSPPLEKETCPPREKETCPPLEGVGGGSPSALRNGWEPFPTTPNIEQASSVEPRTLNIERSSSVETLTPPNVVITGDVMADALQFAATKASAQSDILARLGLQPQRYILATVHRAENTDDPKRLSNIMAALAGLAEREPVILPLHPRTRKILERTSNLEHRTLNLEPRTSNLEPGTLNLEHPSSLRIIDPTGYFDIIALEKSARMLLTDSGGMQKEAYWLKVPCITLRDETEWVETVESGWNILTGADSNRIVTAVQNFTPPKDHPPLYGDGKAAVHCLKALFES